jgi:two-component system, sensor histidine kinase and response regulator
MDEQRPSRRVGYGVALLATGVTFAIRLILWPVLGDAVPHMAFFPAVLLAAYVGGFGPGLLATVLSAVAANVVFTEPHYKLGIKSLNAAVALPLFVLVAVLMSALSESLHRTRHRLVAEERARAAESLREAEERFGQMAENIHEIFWVMDARFERVLYISPAYEEIWGRSRQSLYDQPPGLSLETIHPDDRDQARANMEQNLRGLPTSGEFRVIRPDGSIRWVRTRTFPLKGKDGSLSRICGLSEDITERKRAQEELSQANSRLELAVRGSNVGIWDVTLTDGTFENGRLFAVNLWERLGYAPDTQMEMAERIAMWHPEDRERVLGAVRACLRGERPDFEAEFRVQNRDGSYQWRLHRGVAVRDAAGAPVRFIGSSVDITELMRVEEELRRAKESAESANRAKDEFLANVSHEIRTPLNAILGMTELVIDTPLTEDQRQCLKTVKSAADDLLAVINDLLDFSKIEAGKMALDVADFSLRSILGGALRVLAPRAHQKNLELISHVEPDVSDALVGDTGRLRQVLLNLIGNAIKFTERGEVVVTVKRTEGREQRTEGREQRTENRGQPERREGVEARPSLLSDSPLSASVPSVLCSLPSALCPLSFEVRDTGIGIPADKQEAIFRAFEQEDTSTTRRYGGTGLGLSIAARLAELMGGRITVQSAPGRGSTFTFTAQFGVRAEGAEIPPAPSPALLRGLRVLVVDDNATNRRILEEWLRRWQMDVQTAGDAVAATCALWHAVTEGRPFPLVLLDDRMPDTDGPTLAARIREWAALAATRVVVLTSGDRFGDSTLRRELRPGASLLKPVQQEELLATICRVLESNERETPRAPAPPVAPAPTVPLRILLAEDNAFNAQLMEQLLVRRGHRVRIAQDGREALALAGGGDFDLLLLDVHMPELDGFQVIRGIRERERGTGRHLPVIALTARSRREDRERCLAAGMDDFLTKPVRMPELLAALERIVRPVRPPAPTESVLTPSALLTASENDEELLRKLCGWFRERAPEHRAALAAARASRDGSALREAAHKLASMLAVFSTPAGELASAVEDAATAGELAAASELAARVESAVDALLETTRDLSLDRLRALAAPGAPHG